MIPVSPRMNCRTERLNNLPKGTEQGTSGTGQKPRLPGSRPTQLTPMLCYSAPDCVDAGAYGRGHPPQGFKITWGAGWQVSYRKGSWHHALGSCSEAVEGFLSLWKPDSLGSEHRSDLPQASSAGRQSQSLRPHPNSDTTESTTFPSCLSGGKQGSRPALGAGNPVKHS